MVRLQVGPFGLQLQDNLTLEKHRLLAVLQIAAGLFALTILRLMVCFPDGCGSPPGVTRPRCEELARLRSASLRELTLSLEPVLVYQGSMRDWRLWADRIGVRGVRLCLAPGQGRRRQSGVGLWVSVI